MNTLRVKIALLLAVAIVSVVGLLSVVLFYLLGPPQRVYSLTPVAEQVEMLFRLANEGSGAVPRRCRRRLRPRSIASRVSPPIRRRGA